MIGWLCMTLAVFSFANDGRLQGQLSYAELSLEPAADGLWRIGAEPREFLSLADASDPRCPVPFGLAVSLSDGPIQLCLSFLAALDRRRALLWPEGLENPRAFLKFDVRLEFRALDGRSVSARAQRVVLGLLPRARQGFMSVGDAQYPIDLGIEGTGQIRYPFEALTAPLTATPWEPIDERRFIIDLVYSFPQATSSRSERMIKNLAPRLYNFVSGKLIVRPIILGTTYVEHHEGSARQVPAAQTQMLIELVRDAHALAAMEGKVDRELLIEGIRELLPRAPMDPNLHLTLVESLVMCGRFDEALDTINLFHDFFESYPQFMRLETRLKQRRERNHQEMLRRLARFEPQPPRFDLLQPKRGDLVAGKARVEFDVAAGDEPFHADLRINGELANASAVPPYCMAFDAGGQLGRLNLDLTLYFADETRQSRQSWVRSVYLGDRQTVHLAQVRAVVTRGSKSILSDLRKRDFRILEHGDRRPVEKFVKSEAPLNVAILLDTSSSMAGQKINQAKFAVMRFLERLDAEDSASVYSVDYNIMRLNDFSNDFPDMIATVMTMVPKSSTSLNDALFAAERSLSGRKGTKVIIVVSDGRDTGSKISKSAIESMLQKSPVQVYSVYVPTDDYYEGLESPGRVFMQSLAHLTGSVFHEVRDVSTIHETFDEIYRALKSFYLLDFYLFDDSLHADSIRVEVSRFGAEVHYKPFFKTIDEEHEERVCSDAP